MPFRVNTHKGKKLSTQFIRHRNFENCYQPSIIIIFSALLPIISFTSTIRKVSVYLTIYILLIFLLGFITISYLLMQTTTLGILRYTAINTILLPISVLVYRKESHDLKCFFDFTVNNID